MIFIFSNELIQVPVLPIATVAPVASTVAGVPVGSTVVLRRLKRRKT